MLGPPQVSESAATDEVKFMSPQKCHAIYLYNLPKTEWVAQASLTWLEPHKLKYHGFNSQSGHKPRLQVWSSVWVCIRSNQSLFLTLMFLSFFLSLPLSLKSISMPLGEDLKKQTNKKGVSPGWCGSVDWVSACEARSCWFNSPTGHMPGL